MSFVWTEDISPGAAANAAGMNEVQTNLDTIYTALGITRSGCASGAGWTEFPIAGGLVTDKLSAQPQELRAVTDYAHDNKCPAYNSGYQSGVDTTEDTGYDSGHLSTGYASHYPGFCSNEHGSYNSGDLLNDYGPYNLTYKVTHLGTDCPSHNPTYYPTYYPTDYPTDYPSHNPAYYPEDFPTDYPTDYPSSLHSWGYSNIYSYEGTNPLSVFQLLPFCIPSFSYNRYFITAFIESVISMFVARIIFGIVAR